MEHLPVSRASAHGRLGVMCLHLWKLGLGKDVRHNMADGSESEGTGKATLLSCKTF
jgi:hypothetical protein